MNVTTTIASEFEKLYLHLREEEGRVYTDEEVASLPDINSGHPFYREWRIRKTSARRLVHHLKQKQRELDILEVGCGNGWLSAHLAAAIKGTVTGIDIVDAEIQQAQKVFQQIRNLSFIHGHLNDTVLPDKKFDVIVFAASAPYFASLKKLVADASVHLTLQGEIHLLDAPFYPQQEIAAAKQRSLEHFTTLGVPQMAAFYFYHSISDIKKFNYRFLYDPVSWASKLSLQNSPFHHVIIKNRYQ
ncbi:class I SAM-dependent methyltransferase [Ferruginibacter sp.]